MNTIQINNETRFSDLEKFCGEYLIPFTGQTFVKTSEGNILIEFGDTISKKDDGSISVIKAHQS